MKDNKDENQVPSDKNPMEESAVPLDANKNQESLYSDELEDTDEKAEIEYGKTAVARGTKQNMVMVGGLLLVVALIVYFTFFHFQKWYGILKHRFLLPALVIKK